MEDNNILKNITTAQIEELVRRIQKLEDTHAHLKREISDLMISHDPQKSNRPSTVVADILSSVDLTTRHFCWHWLHGDLEREYAVKMNSIVPAKVVSQPRSNTICHSGNNTFWPRSSSFNIADEINWEDLIIRERIGRGSCGPVYHAMWNGSDVALRTFFKHEYSYDLMLSFRQEISLMKRLRHPNILLFMGAVTSPQCLCIVTEFLPRSLFQLLHRNTARLNWRIRVQMAMDIALGMCYLHNHYPPIIHCDLKSSNIVVGKNWRVKIGNFGLCQLKYEAYVTTEEELGKPEWIAPEVLRTKQADEKSDVYSYGVVLWEITTQKIPGDGLNSMQVMKAARFMKQQLDIPKDVDPQWGCLTERCLSSEPESRPTFQEILDELNELQIKFAVQIESTAGVEQVQYEFNA